MRRHYVGIIFFFAPLGWGVGFTAWVSVFGAWIMEAFCGK